MASRFKTLKRNFLEDLSSLGNIKSNVKYRKCRLPLQSYQGICSVRGSVNISLYVRPTQLKKDLPTGQELNTQEIWGCVLKDWGCYAVQNRFRSPSARRLREDTRRKKDIMLEPTPGDIRTLETVGKSDQ